MTAESSGGERGYNVRDKQKGGTMNYWDDETWQGSEPPLTTEERSELAAAEAEIAQAAMDNAK